jgi:hypothetical protein
MNSTAEKNSRPTHLQKAQEGIFLFYRVRQWRYPTFRRRSRNGDRRLSGSVPWWWWWWGQLRARCCCAKQLSESPIQSPPFPVLGFVPDSWRKACHPNTTYIVSSGTLSKWRASCRCSSKVRCNVHGLCQRRSATRAFLSSWHRENPK